MAKYLSIVAAGYPGGMMFGFLPWLFWQYKHEYKHEKQHVQERCYKWAFTKWKRTMR